MSRGDRVLVVNADDFGYASSVNQGIVEAHARGIVTATTWLAAGDAADEAVRLAAQTPTLDVGLHLALSEMTPCAPPERVSALLRAGRMHAGYGRALLNATFSPAAVRAAEVEWRAQYERFRNRFGRAPSHVDSHQHVAQAPALQRLFLELAVEHDVPYVRIPEELTSSADLRRRPGARRLPAAMVLSVLARRMRRGARDRRIGTTDRFWGFRSSGRASLADLRDAAENLPSGVTEWMVHPGTAVTTDGCRRPAELAALTSRELRDELESRQVRLASFRDLASAVPPTPA